MSYRRNNNTRSTKTAAERTDDLFAEVTAAITGAIQTVIDNGGTFEWVKSWGSAEAFRNAISGKPYRGINPILLTFLPYTDPRFITFKQGIALSKKVEGARFLKEGQKSTRVVFWKFYEKKDKATGEVSDRYALLKHYCVFNVEQTNLVELGLLPAFTLPDVEPFVAIEQAEQIVKKFVERTGVQIREGGDKAAYVPALDIIFIPKRETFKTPASFYRTLFHEIVHALGAASRLSREGITNFDRFGSEKYADEELIAEVGSAFFGALAGLEADTDQSAAYIGGWLRRLQNDTRLIERASRAAQKAVDYLFGYTYGETDESSDDDEGGEGEGE
jgi:antirestriction protein ArdC